MSERKRANNDSTQRERRVEGGGREGRRRGSKCGGRRLDWGDELTDITPLPCCKIAHLIYIIVLTEVTLY